ncbi:hypothetical protein PMI09_01796 [Rhizobium sp. CF122]|nr:hypothetical protein PMI09_01796 [Rhizobium sp. CF122]
MRLQRANVAPTYPDAGFDAMIWPFVRLAKE